MIGIVGYLKYKEAQFSEQNITAKARYVIGS
jgi:N6-L-threonylcarbamoyladenine synthase